MSEYEIIIITRSTHCSFFLTILTSWEARGVFAHVLLIYGTASIWEYYAGVQARIQGFKRRGDLKDDTTQHGATQLIDGFGLDFFSNIILYYTPRV